MPVSGGEALIKRDHRRDLAPMVRGVVDDVLEQRPERHAELLARGVLVGDRSREIGLAEALDERALLGFERVPGRPQSPSVGKSASPGSRAGDPPFQRESQMKSAP